LLCTVNPKLCLYGKKIKSIVRSREKFRIKNVNEFNKIRTIFIDTNIGSFWGGVQLWITSKGLDSCSNKCLLTTNADNADMIIYNLEVPKNARSDQINVIVNFEAYSYSRNTDDNTILVSYHQESDLIATYAYSVMHAFNLCIGDTKTTTKNGMKCENMIDKDTPFYRWCDNTYHGNLFTCIFNIVPHISQTNVVKKSTEVLAVSWMSNKCERHDNYVLKLMEYMKIDCMGGCYKNYNEMNHKAWQVQDFDSIWWGKDNSASLIEGNGNKKMLIGSHYKYFLSIENTILDDYVTEKFYEGLLTDSVMVYLGAPNILYYAPSPHSFINALDFNGPAELAKYLIDLASDEDRYNSYFKWRKQNEIIVSTGFKQAMENDITRLDNMSMLCRLCDMI